MEIGSNKDTEEAADEDFVSPPTHDRRRLEGTRRFLLGVLVPVLGSAAGLVAGLAALMYVLGLLALWIPIYRTYTHDLAAAWYAASLVPNTVVAGIGVGQFLATPSVFLTVVLLFTLVMFPVIYVLDPLYSYAEKHLSRRGFGNFLFFLEFSAWGLFLFSVFWFSVSVGHSVLYALIATTLVALLMLAPRLFTAWRIRKRRHQNGDATLKNHAPEKSPERDASTWMNQLKRRVEMVWLGLIYGGFYIFFAVLAMLATPPLPTATINGESHIEGKLLAHNDGFWYVFHRDEKKQPWRLVAVPDSKVKTVEVLSEGR